MQESKNLNTDNEKNYFYILVFKATFFVILLFSEKTDKYKFFQKLILTIHFIEVY